MKIDFPDDENGDVLRRMQEKGDYLTKPRDVDFTVVFATEEPARTFADHFQQLGYSCSVTMSNCKPDLPWDVLIVNHMVPAHSAIAKFEEELQFVADGLGGRNDGWGCITQVG